MKLRNISSEWPTAIAAAAAAGLELPYEKGFFSRIQGRPYIAVDQSQTQTLSLNFGKCHSILERKHCHVKGVTTLYPVSGSFQQRDGYSNAMY